MVNVLGYIFKKYLKCHVLDIFKQNSAKTLKFRSFDIYLPYLIYIHSLKGLTRTALTLFIF